jgi:hypothetical protein
VQRAAQLAGLALAVEFLGDGDGVGIQFDDGVDARTGLVDGGDARQVLLHQGLRAQLACRHLGLLLLDACVQDTGIRTASAACRTRHRCDTRRHTRTYAQPNEIPALHTSLHVR